MRTRLRPAYSEAELRALYDKPHSHRHWPDHRLRVQETIKLINELIPADQLEGQGLRVADLSCGDATIVSQIPASERYLGDIAPGPGIVAWGPIERTIRKIPHVDLFICCETLEHLDDPVQTLADIRLKADALVMSTPIGETEASNPEHYWGWDVQGIEELLDATAWTPVIQRNVNYPGEKDENGTVWAPASYQLWGCR